MGLNNDRGERIPKSLINVPESVGVIRANGPVFTLGQEFTVTLLRKKVWRGWITRRLVWRAQKLARTSFTQRSNDMALPWHSHCDQLTVRFELGSKRISSYSPSGCIHHAISIRKIWILTRLCRTMGLYFFDMHPTRTRFRNGANQIPAIPVVQLVNPFMGNQLFWNPNGKLLSIGIIMGKERSGYTCKDHHTSYLVWIIALDVDGDDLPMGKQIGKPMQFWWFLWVTASFLGLGDGVYHPFLAEKAGKWWYSAVFFLVA